MTVDSLLTVLHQGQEFCRGVLPPSRHPSLFAALICGTQIDDGESLRLFLDTGLIHLMVVSGAHLIFVERLLARLPLALRLSLLGFYCWLTGFGAPVVKAFVRRLVELALSKYGWTGLQCELLAVALILVAIPSWWLSRSLLMSWMCTLAFMLPPLLRVFDRPVKAYLLLFAFCATSPLTILWNAVLAPLIGDILFPACLLAILVPALAPMIDGLWDGFLYVLESGPQATPLNYFVPSSQIFFLPLLAHLTFLVWEVRWRRVRAFSF